MQRRNRRGAQLVEFALVLPIFMVLMSGIVDYGWTFWQQHGLVTAAGEGVRAASLTLLYEDPAAEAEEKVSAVLDAYAIEAEPTITTTFQGSPPDRMVRVEVSVPTDQLFGLVPTPETLSTSLVARMEDQESEAVALAP